jgi:hypothetical protein
MLCCGGTTGLGAGGDPGKRQAAPVATARCCRSHHPLPQACHWTGAVLPRMRHCLSMKQAPSLRVCAPSTLAAGLLCTPAAAAAADPKP